MAENSGVESNGAFKINERERENCFTTRNAFSKNIEVFLYGFLTDEFVEIAWPEVIFEEEVFLCSHRTEHGIHTGFVFHVYSQSLESFLRLSLSNCSKPASLE